MTKICRKCIIKKCKNYQHHRTGTCPKHRYITVDKLDYPLDEIINSFGYNILKNTPFEGDSLPYPKKTKNELDIELDIITIERELYKNKIEEDNNDFILL